jgi:sucrose-6-phosphate hydrolase SacC (GH32 family)
MTLGCKTGHDRDMRLNFPSTGKRVLIGALTVGIAGLLQTLGADDVPIGRFEPASFGNWKATGTAFGSGPVSGAALTRLGIENSSGAAVATSKVDGDKPTGTLTSPPFRIEKPYIAFRISGGDYERDTCLNLLLNGTIAKSATGWRSDRLVPTSWDVSRFMGQTAQIEIVDASTGDWGHINVADIVQTDHPERWSVVTEPLYQEAFRPQFHFTARQWTMDRLNPGMQQEGWINDLNGLIYYDGEYHLFAQRWAKCWLHAVSRDLVHWTELEPAFWEEHAGSGTQSGTCVVDYQNTSGLASDPAQPAMVAFFPRWDNRNQCIAYSLDHGRSWNYYEHNPILTHPERDPKVFWYAPARHWVMVLYGDSQYHILTSTNLLTWKDEHHPITNSFECPDLFELPIDGDRAQKKWVLIQGNGNYSIGSFDGTRFDEEGERHPCDVGTNFYATQTWHNTDTGDGRRIQTAWMRGSSFPDMPFNQQISFPCELSLHRTSNGLRLFRKPIQEIALLHRSPDSWTNRTLNSDQTLPLEPSGRSFHIQAKVRIPAGARLKFNLRGVPVVLTSNSLESGSGPVAATSPITAVEILLDCASLEVFINDGEVSLTRYILPHDNGLSVKAEAGSATLDSFVIYPLNSIWEARPVEKSHP